MAIQSTMCIWWSLQTSDSDKKSSPLEAAAEDHKKDISQEHLTIEETKTSKEAANDSKASRSLPVPVFLLFSTLFPYLLSHSDFLFFVLTTVLDSSHRADDSWSSCSFLFPCF